MNFGFSIDAGAPFDIHLEESTGWSGPYSVIFAQNSSKASIFLSSSEEEEGEERIDRYISRYVETLSTPYLRMGSPPNNASLLEPVDFDTILGVQAVNTTIHTQTTREHGADPYNEYLKTCDNGNLRPILPSIQFEFSESSRDRNSNNRESCRRVEPSKDITLDANVEFKILAIPDKKDQLYDLFPSLQKHFNVKNGGFSISGPYCYGDDPERAFTFDYSFSSVRPTEGVSFVQGCVADLPCLPPQAAVTESVTNITWYNHTFVPIQGSNDITNAMLFFACYSLLFALIISLTCTCQLSNKLKSLQSSSGPFHVRPLVSDRYRRADQDETVSPYGDMEHAGDGSNFNSRSLLEEPLLRKRRNQPADHSHPSSDPPPSTSQADPEESS